VEKMRQKILANKANWLHIRKAIKDMRTRLEDSKPQTHLWDIKRGPGGLQDIELLAQGIALAGGCYEFDIVLKFYSGMKVNFFDSMQLEKLVEIFEFYSHMRLINVLMCGRDFNRSELALGARERLHQIVEADRGVDLEQVLISSRLRCIEIIDSVLMNTKGLHDVDKRC
jgi:glutamate-ammonia-ligase adenylyltransferase